MPNLIFLHRGMISFRESNLVYTPGLSSAYNKKRVSAVVSHEIAHMWFGNLVRPFCFKKCCHGTFSWKILLKFHTRFFV